MLSERLQAEFHPQRNDPLTLQEVKPGSNKKIWWQCSQGHEWEASPNSRSRGNGCPYCSGRLPIVGITDLATTHPTLLTEWVFDRSSITPTAVSAGSNRKAWWQCPFGHLWEASVKTRSKGSGCPYCAGQRLMRGINDLATTYPGVAQQWHPTKNEGLTPSDITQRSGQYAWWQCGQGHEWRAIISSRTQGNGCGQCAGRTNSTQNGERPRVALDQKNLVISHPNIAQEWHPTRNPLFPNQFYPSSGKLVWWQCTKGHEWESRISNRTTKGNACPYCSNRKIRRGDNDFAHTFPALAVQWHPTRNGSLQATEVAPSSSLKVWWQCDQKHEWQTWVYARVAGSGCPRCFCVKVSKGEASLSQWITSLGLTNKFNTRKVIQPYELDIYLPEFKLGIEFNGVYWHSEAAGRGKDYHLKKVKAAQAAGITLFQVWEDDWRDREAIIKRMILHRLGLSNEPVVFARKTKILELTTSQAHAFLEQNHIQGKANGGLYLGLTFEGTLVACMVLKRMPGGIIYLERYATSARVPGGFTRLLKHAVRALKPSKIITFADQSISDGNLYEKNGFVVDTILKPDYTYLAGRQRVHKFNYRLERFRDDPTLQYQEGLSERELAILNSLHRIWDSGKIRYVFIP